MSAVDTSPLGSALSLLDGDLETRSIDFVRHSNTRIDLAAIVRIGDRGIIGHRE